MPFSMPTNWTDSAIDAAVMGGAVELAGAAVLPNPIGHAAFFAPAVGTMTPVQCATHIDRARRRGLSFNYIVDAPCLGNREYDVVIRDQMRDHLLWASDQGVTTVTVGNGFLIEFVKKHLGHLRVVVSASAFVDSVERARQLASLGADEITVHPDANRDFSFLAALRKGVDARHRLIVNHGCAFQCMYLHYHALYLGHASREGRPFDEGRPRCEADFHGAALYKSRWIRPEDLHKYIEFGFDFFVIHGQNRDAGWLRAAATAYGAGAHAGNLMTFMDGGIRRQFTPDLDVPGGLLTHFLARFDTAWCKNHCDACDHCETTAQQALSHRRSR